MRQESLRPVPISIRCRDARADREALRRLVRRCLDAENAPASYGAGLVLAGDRLVRRLNRQWRGIDRTTDVLAFPVEDDIPLPPGLDEEGASTVGEVIVSVPRCRQQALEAGTDAGVELVRLVVHGVLHLVGHDHNLEGDARAMRRRERALRAWAEREGMGPSLLGDPDGSGRGGAP